MRSSPTAVSAAFDFIEKGFDADLGTVRMGARDYDPRLGQFWSADPLYLEGIDRCLESTVDCNLYAYARNSPVQYSDPSGLMPFDAPEAMANAMFDQGYRVADSCQSGDRAACGVVAGAAVATMAFMLPVAFTAKAAAVTTVAGLGGGAATLETGLDVVGAVTAAPGCLGGDSESCKAAAVSTVDLLTGPNPVGDALMCRRASDWLGSRGGATKAGPTKTDRLKEHLTPRDLDAARREAAGEVVARKPDGTPWNHVMEVREAQQGLLKRIDRINRSLGDSSLPPAQREALQRELSEASRLLDKSEGFLPR